MGKTPGSFQPIRFSNDAWYNFFARNASALRHFFCLPESVQLVLVQMQHPVDPSRLLMMHVPVWSTLAPTSYFDYAAECNESTVRM